MNRTLLTLAMASLLATGCARATLAPTAATPASTPAETPAAAAEETTAKAAPSPAADATASEAETTGARKAGDFIVYRFTGSFRKAPLTLTERVIERRGAMLTVDITAEEGESKRQ